jgi:hypothetical protein
VLVKNVMELNVMEQVHASKTTIVSRMILLTSAP